MRTYDNSLWREHLLPVLTHLSYCWDSGEGGEHAHLGPSFILPLSTACPEKDTFQSRYPLRGLVGWLCHAKGKCLQFRGGGEKMFNSRKNQETEFVWTFTPQPLVLTAAIIKLIFWFLRFHSNIYFFLGSESEKWRKRYYTLTFQNCSTLWNQAKNYL